MTQQRIGSGGRLAIGLAVVGSLVAAVNVGMDYRASGTVDWGRIALIVGVPAFIYAVVSSRKAQ